MLFLCLIHSKVYLRVGITPGLCRLTSVQPLIGSTIDFSINGLCMGKHFYHNGPKTIRKKRKFVDFLMRIELTPAILSPLLLDFRRNSTIHFHMFLYLLICFLRVAVSLLYRSQAVSKIQYSNLSLSN